MATATRPRRAAGPSRFTWHAGWTALLALAILTARSLADDPTTLDGVWRSTGYNRVITIEGGQFALYETTPICLLKVKEGDLEALQPLVGTVQRDIDGKHLSSTFAVLSG